MRDLSGHGLDLCRSAVVTLSWTVDLWGTETDIEERIHVIVAEMDQFGIFTPGARRHPVNDNDRFQICD